MTKSCSSLNMMIVPSGAWVLLELGLSLASPNLPILLLSMNQNLLEDKEMQ